LERCFEQNPGALFIPILRTLNFGIIFEHTLENKIMKRLAFLLIVPLAFACKTQKEAVEESPEAATSGNGSVEVIANSEENTDTDSKPQRPYEVKATVGDVTQKSDFYTIKSAEIEGNDLLLEVEYSGGCARHDFKFVGSPALSKSLPPQRAVRLIHKNGGDECESWVNRTIRVDLSALAVTQTPGSQVILKLADYPEDLPYMFE